MHCFVPTLLQTIKESRTALAILSRTTKRQLVLQVIVFPYIVPVHIYPDLPQNAILFIPACFEFIKIRDIVFGLRAEGFRAVLAPEPKLIVDRESPVYSNRGHALGSKKIKTRLKVIIFRHQFQGYHIS